MSRRRCCCGGSNLFCSCPTNASGYVGTACQCTLLDCDNPPAGLAGCCTQVFTISATCSGMLYAQNAHCVFNAGDSTTVAMIPDIWAPATPAACNVCAGLGPCTTGSTANDFTSFQTNYPCRSFPITPYMINRWMATPTNCTFTGPIPWAQRYAPNVCLDANFCWVNAYMESFVPTLYHGTYNATFKWQVIGTNSRRLTVCNSSNYNSVNITKLSASSNCGMDITSFEVVCKTIDGQAYFIVQLAWTPLMNVTLTGPSFGGNSCSGPTPPSAINQSNLTYGTGFTTGGFGPIGCGSVPIATVFIRYRIAVGAPGDQPCGIRPGTYAPYEIFDPTNNFHISTLGAFPSLTVS